MKPQLTKRGPKLFRMLLNDELAPLILKVLVKASQNLVKIFSLDFRANILGVFNVGAYSNTFPNQSAVMMAIQIAQLVIKYK